MKEVETYFDLIDNVKKEQFDAYRKLLQEYNQRYNLTSITDNEGVRVKHFLDSVVGEFAFPKNANVVEVGSGGGFPSLPLKIVRPDLSFTLIESTGKKCEFLKTVVKELGLQGVTVKNIRAEDGGRDGTMREKFDVACARAVARLNTLCEYCVPFVKVGGKFVAYKGNAEEEVAEAVHAVKVLGCEIAHSTCYTLPHDEGNRTIIEIVKTKPTPALYPRGQGKERKKPL